MIILVGWPYTDDKFATVLRYYIGFILTLFVCMLTGVLYCSIKLRHFIDHWEIRSEFGKLLTSGIILTIFVAIKMIVRLIHPIFHDDISSVLNGIALAMWMMYSWYVSIIWVNNTNTKKYSKLSEKNAMTIVDVLQDPQSLVIHRT